MNNIDRIKELILKHTQIEYHQPSKTYIAWIHGIGKTSLSECDNFANVAHQKLMVEVDDLIYSATEERLDKWITNLEGKTAIRQSPPTSGTYDVSLPIGYDITDLILNDGILHYKEIRDVNSNAALKMLVDLYKQPANCEYIPVSIRGSLFSHVVFYSQEINVSREKFIEFVCGLN